MNASYFLAAALVCASGVALSGCALGDSPGAPSSAETPFATDTAPPVQIEPVMVTADADADGETVSVSGYVAGVIEDGGMCDFIFSQESDVLTLSNSGNADRSVTSCGLASGPISEFKKGSWSVTLNYTAISGVSYKSEPLTMEIP